METVIYLATVTDAADFGKVLATRAFKDQDKARVWASYKRDALTDIQTAEEGSSDFVDVRYNIETITYEG